MVVWMDREGIMGRRQEETKRQVNSTANLFRDTSSGVNAMLAGIQTESLQTVMDGYAQSLNQSAIAKSTGAPVRTPSSAYKGFAAEEYFKQTLKINALAEGIPD